MKLTTRTRLGFGWSNTPKRNEWSIELDTEPSEFGTIAQLEKTVDYFHKVNSGNEWTWSYYAKIDGEWLRLGRSFSQDIRTDFWVAQDSNQLGQFAVTIDKEYIESAVKFLLDRS